MSTPRTALVAALACLSLLTACSSSSSPPAPSSSAAPATSEVAVPVPGVSVTVRNPGAEPRTTLTTRTTDQTRQQVSMTATSSVVQTVGDSEPLDQTVPDVTLPLEVSQQGPADDTHTLLLRNGTPTSPDATLAATLAKAAGSTSKLEVGTDNAPKQLVLDPPAELDDAGRSALEQALRQLTQFMPVLPTTPVGPGAVWTVSLQVNSLGLLLRQDTTFTLQQVNGSVLTLGVELAQVPTSPAWQLPDGQGTLDITSYQVGGTGSLTMDLAKPLPTAGTVRLAGDQVFTRATDNLKLGQRVDSSVSWQS
ncbi:hypothetical protein [Rhodococcus sp. X156]|uniref:hypothetical protein n=1 Tax=Rhodococcus sp. X156 TaxID=2499145 RepID=UPI000FD895A0|nr:hypothetical protein [Rhodococcus sp. X156]